MNRLFGKGKSKEPPPNLTDCIANVSDAKQRSNFLSKIHFVCSNVKCTIERLELNHGKLAMFKEMCARWAYFFTLLEFRLF